MKPKPIGKVFFPACMPEVHHYGVTVYDSFWAKNFHQSFERVELLHVLKGHLDLVLPDRRIRVGPGGVAFVPSGMKHRDEFDFDEGLEVFMVVFQWDAEKKFFARAGYALPDTMEPPARTEIRMILDRMRADDCGDSEADRLVANVRLLGVLTLIMRAAGAKRSGRRAAPQESYRERKRGMLMRRARDYVEKHYAAPVTLEGIARALNVSPFYLSHVFSEESDYSLFTYLTTLRMEKARALLAGGRLNVSEVARAVGYDDSSYFSKVFRRHCGKPPKDYALCR
ncbi:MAG: AraC family transcriptional regulator [Lentisphaerae bacterium]|nr:AraC family transcriptional regulator [Lentisphaerota bacterium]